MRLREFDDPETIRSAIFDQVMGAVKARFPVENDRYRLEVANLAWDSDKPFSIDEQKQALLSRGSLNRKINGEWRLVDRATNKIVDSRPGVIAHVPWMTPRGTFVRNGSEYTIANQMRLRPAVYTRRKENQELEAHFNTLPGTGRAFRIFMEPETGVFKMHIGQANLPLYPILRALGVPDNKLEQRWGKDMLNANRGARQDSQAVSKLYQRLVGSDDPDDDQVPAIAKAFGGMRMDPQVVERNLGPWLRPAGQKQADQSMPTNVSPELMMAATRKLMDIRAGTAEPDDRDALTNQTFHGPEDFFAERVRKDAGGIVRKILWNSTNKSKLVGIHSGTLTPQLESVLLNSGMAQPIEEINPLEMSDQMFRVLRLGEGGIPSRDAIPDEARAVQPSQFGYIDPFRGPESEALGVDTRLALHTFKGDDGNLYSNFRDVRTGKVVPLSAQAAADKVLAFPGEMQRGEKKVRAMVRGKLEYVDRREVDYELPHSSGMLNANVNLIPMSSATQGNRLLMAGKVVNQAMALREPEAPLVQSETEQPGVSFEALLGRKVGAVFAQKPGVVRQVRANKILVDHADGTPGVYELYHNFPLNRKSYLHNTPLAKAGDRVVAGQPLARSNFTDKNGDLAIGANLRVALVPYAGLTYEDALVLSESAAKKLSSEHMYTPELEFEKGLTPGYDKFISQFPTKYKKEQLGSIGKDGVVKPGTVVHKGDPLILAVGQVPRKAEGQWTQISRKVEQEQRDRSVEWEHDFEGVVTDVVPGKDGVQVAVRAYVPAQEGDKFSGRYGDKGVCSKIIPDSQMPKDSQGRPFEMLQNPATLPSRLNPAQIFEMQLAKIARKTGKPVKVPAFMDGSMVDWVQQQLKAHSLKDTEDLEDPELPARKIKDVLTGEKFVMKLHHTSESKWGARETGGYTSEGQPSSGGREGSKTIANLGMNALLAHGAISVLRDTKLVRGQKNDDFWRSFKLGYPPPTPEIPLVYRKFMNYLRGSGINIAKDGDRLNLMAMTDADVDRISKGTIRSADTVNAKDLQPIEGGLFDRGITGGHGGENWASIELAEPLPNPVMEEPIRRLLGLTQKALEAVLRGTQTLHGLTGGAAIKEALARIKVPDAIERARAEIKGRSGSGRDDAIKRLRYLEMARSTGLKLSDMVISKVPVIPPNYRPISRLKENMQVASDANYLYQDLLFNDEAYRGVKKELGAEHAGAERLNTYRALKAVTGLGDPVHPKLQEKGVAGLLQHVFGKGSPKFGLVQRRVIGSKVDMAGRAAITPNPSLDMDQVGLPEEQAWTVYAPFVVRRLVRKGMSAVQAAKLVEGRDRLAKDELLEEMSRRPLIISRAPTLHKFGMMASYPTLVKGNTLQVSPLVTPGFGADFDGDQQIDHVFVLLKKSLRGLSRQSKSLLEGRDMTAYFKQHLAVLDGESVYMVHLEDFPRTELEKTTRGRHGPIEWYRVPAGVKVLAYNEAEGRIVPQAVKYWTRHVGCPVEVITLRSGREICSDDDPRAVYGLDPGTMALGRYTPEEAVRRRILVPRMTKLDTTPLVDIRAVPTGARKSANTLTKDLKPLLPVDEHLGYFLGVMVGDGWVGLDGGVCTDLKISSVCWDLVKKIDRIMRTFYTGPAPARHSSENSSGYGQSWTHVYYSAAAARWLCPLIGLGAQNKHLPPFFLAKSRKFRSALLAGLMDTDGSISRNRSGGKKCYRLQVDYSSTSLRLVQEVKLLAASLGISSRVVTQTRADGSKAWGLKLSAAGTKAWGGEYMVNSEKLANLRRTAVDKEASAALGGSLVPISAALIQSLREALGVDKGYRHKPKGLIAAYRALMRAKKFGTMPQATALKIKTYLKQRVSEIPGCAEWLALASNPGVTWDAVESVTRTGMVEEGYDLTVPGSETFVNAAGIVLSNTMSYHVPVSEDAVAEAKDKMLPSRNLRSVKEFDIHYLPRHEYQHGLYQAATKKTGRAPQRFLSVKDALAAYKRGDLDLGDEVIIHK